MNRLLRISFNTAFLSLIPILSWFVIGILIDKNLTNVFTLTYPLQFVWLLLKSIFGTGANICKEKEKNENAVGSGMTLGSIIGLGIFGFVALNIESYISFMNMDIATYKEFAFYSVVQLYIQLVFSFILEKLYFEDKNKLANKYCLLFNMLNFVTLIISSLLFSSKMAIVITTLLVIFLYLIFLIAKTYQKFKLEIHIIKYIKYDSVEVFNSIAFFIIFLFGLSNVLEYGEKYATALNFVALITDAQWDTFEAVATVAKIDISKNKFNYREHRNNAYKLLFLLLSTVFIMFVTLYSFYELNFGITMIYLSFELVNFVVFPIYRLKTCYLQLEYSAIKTTSNKIISSILRMVISFIKTPFCTGMGQVCSAIYQFFSVNILFHRNFRINKDGTIKRWNKDE